jgi:hypothetical protein
MDVLDNEKHKRVGCTLPLPIPIDGGCPSNECSGCVKQAYLNRSRAFSQADRGCQLKSSCKDGEWILAEALKARVTYRISQVRRREFSFVLHLLTAVNVVTCATGLSALENSKGFRRCPDPCIGVSTVGRQHRGTPWPTRLRARH